MTNQLSQLSEFLKDFGDPPAEYRVKPFWFWNDRLEAGEIAAQIQNFCAMGLGGFFIHARFGLETPYMSEQWLDMVEVAVLEAKRCGLEVWLYDENLFPSGIGDTKVSKMAKCRVRFIEYGVFQTLSGPGGAYVPLDVLPDGCEIFSAQHVSDEGQTLLNYRMEGGKVFVDGGGEVALFWINTIHSDNDMLFGVDYLNPDTLRAFIECTHEIYKRRFKQWFGTVIKGFFTDEPTLLPWHHDGGWYTKRGDGRCAPYTPALMKEMKEMKEMEEMEEMEESAADLGTVAGALFFDCGDARRAGELRRIYWRTVSRLYRDNFFGAYAKWCEDNALMLTGHVLLEEGLYFNHIFQSGPLPGLSSMHMPGVDQLTARAESDSMSYMVGSSPHMPALKTNMTGPKLVSSIAHTAGRRRVLSESFGLGGWGMQYRQMKAVLDWEYALGVNALCPHAFFYSIKGFRKNDAPPCHYHGADASLYRHFADYAARISWALSQGEPVADTAVLYPESAFRQSYAVGRQRTGDAAISDAFDLVCAAMQNEHRLYEIITEHDLASAWLEGGELLIKKSSPRSAIRESICGTGGLRFGHVVVISPEGLDKSALALLDRFAAAGGRVLVLNGNKDQSARATTRGDMREVLSGFLSDENIDGMRLDGEGGELVYAICRQTPIGNIWFFANTDRHSAFCGRVAFPGRSIARLDAESGTYGETGGGEAELNLAPAGSALMLVTDGDGEGEAKTEAHRPESPETVETVELENGGWAFCAEGYNALHINRWIHEVNCRGMTTEYRYTADIQSETDVGEVYVALDDIVPGSSVMGSGDIEVSLGGHVCTPEGWHLCKGFPTFRSGGLKKGDNTLAVTIRCDAWSGEPQPLKYGAVLLGRFALKKHGKSRCIAPEPALVGLDPWNEQGYPFYSGSARYSKRAKLRGGHYAAELGECEGAAQLLVDGQDMGTRLWPPFRWHFRADGKAGEVEFAVVATNTPANYMGEERPSGPKGPLRITQVVR